MSSLLSVVKSLDTWQQVALLPAAVVLYHLIPWLLDEHGTRWVPGPFWAKFSDFWLVSVAVQGHRGEVVHELHKKYGTFVRIAPNHVSISDPDALQEIYAHGNGSLKSHFYDAFVSIRRGLFNTRDRAEHTRKRKIVAHIFSQKNVLGFEPHVRHHIGTLFNQWDRLCELAKQGKSGPEGEGWHGKDGKLWLDSLHWYNYLAFDIIGDLAFGKPFGMLERAKDSAQIVKDQEAAISSYGKGPVEYIEVPAVQVINDRGDYSASMGVLPLWIRPYAKKVPWFAKGCQAVSNLAGIAIAAVGQRLAAQEAGEIDNRNDLLAKLQEGKDDDGNLMGREELTAEALTQLIAGSDTTSNSSCAITYHLARNPRVQEKLQKELDEHLGNDDDPVSAYETVKRLPYLEAVINEGLRIHSTSSIGLPRIVPDSGLTVSGKFFPGGSILSVPSYTIHRDTKVWGDDVEVFRPERWFERDNAMIQKTFNPFSYGPRACVGKNLANMELLIIISSVLRRYSFVLPDPNMPLVTREGFLRKPLASPVGIVRRE